MQKKKPWSTGKIAITTTLLTVIGGGIFMLTNNYLNSNANKNISKEGSPKIDSINTVPPNNKIEVTNNGQGSQNNEIVIGTKSIQNYNVNKTKDSPRLKIQSPIIYIDEKVTSTNQQGGITAHTVVIPEDKTVDLKDNYLVTEYQLGATWGNRKGLQLKPKQGVWNVPFIAIPLTESEKVFPNLSTLNGSMQGQEGTTWVKNPQGDSLQLKYFINTSGSATKDNGYLFSFRIKPTFLVFGDWGNPNKWYTIYF